MNRRHHRHHRRTRLQVDVRNARNELREYGCTCTPRITPDETNADMLQVVHAVGCEFGDFVRQLNLLGIMPTFKRRGQR